jgi:archaellum component FlaC
MEMIIWNVVLSAFLGVIVFVFKEKATELKRLEILLNKTREEVARDNVTQAEIDKIVTHIDSRFDKLNDKIDLFIRESKSALN